MKRRQVRRPAGAGCLETFPGSGYSDEEREFLQAIDRYKRCRQRPHPTWLEVLHVLRGLGWRKEPPQTTGVGVPSPSPREGEG